MPTSAAVANPGAIGVYNAWVLENQQSRRKGVAMPGIDLSTSYPPDTKDPPVYPHRTLFQENAEEYAADMTSIPSKGFFKIAQSTFDAGLWAPCMVGRIEGQFLKFVVQMMNAKSILDIGTFTGYSALSFAEGCTSEGHVFTLEGNAKCAALARENFKNIKHGEKVTVVEGDAVESMKKMMKEGKKFDIVFIDADKVNYINYYEMALSMLSEGGMIMADNALSQLVFEDDDPTRKDLHQFAQYVRADERVEQVILTVREGVMMVRKK